jgi:sulfoxide reductase heme-binding subunit YedZ
MFEEATLRLLLRISARVSLVFFLAAFAGRAANILWPSAVSNWLMRNTHRFILALGASHTFHLAAIVALAFTLGHRFVEETGWTGIILGGIVYLVLYGLVLQALAPTRNFKIISSPRFHSIAMHVLWFVFAFAFVAGSFMRPWPYLPFAVLAVAALFMRVLGNRRATQHSAAVAS